MVVLTVTHYQSDKEFKLYYGIGAGNKIYRWKQGDSHHTREVVPYIGY